MRIGLSICGLVLIISGCRGNVPGTCSRDDECPARSRCEESANVCVREYENFELIPLSAPVFVRRGESASITLTFQRADRVRLPIAVEIGPLPSGVTAEAITVRPEQTSAALTLKIGKDMSLGAFPTSVTATAGDMQRTQAIEINVSESNAPLWDAMSWDQANWN